MSYFQQFRLDSNRFLKKTVCDEERGVFFESSKWVHGILETLRTSSNKVGFFLQLGYFSYVSRFNQLYSCSMLFIKFLCNPNYIDSLEARSIGHQLA